MEHRLTRVALSLALGLLVSAAASAASLSIANPGFEQLALDDGNWVFTLPGWANSGDSGTFDPTVAQYPNQNAYEGENVAFSSLEGPWISQVLAEVLQANTRYVLTVRVGSRSDAPFAGYAIELRAGSTVLSVDDNTLQPPAGTFLASAIAYSSGANDGMIGQPLEVRFRSFGRQVNFDDVSLTAQPIPEPSTYLLFAGGLAAVVGYTRRKAA